MLILRAARSNHAVATAFALAVIGAACGGSDDGAAHIVSSAPASASAVATTTVAQASVTPTCVLLDVADVAAAVGNAVAVPERLQANDTTCRYEGRDLTERTVEVTTYTGGTASLTFHAVAPEQREEIAGLGRLAYFVVLDRTSAAVRVRAAAGGNLDAPPEADIYVEVELETDDVEAIDARPILEQLANTVIDRLSDPALGYVAGCCET